MKCIVKIYALIYLFIHKWEKIKSIVYLWKSSRYFKKKYSDALHQIKWHSPLFWQGSSKHKICASPIGCHYEKTSLGDQILEQPIQWWL